MWCPMPSKIKEGYAKGQLYPIWPCASYACFSFAGRGNNPGDTMEQTVLHSLMDVPYQITAFFLLRLLTIMQKLKP